MKAVESFGGVICGREREAELLESEKQREREVLEVRSAMAAMRKTDAEWKDLQAKVAEATAERYLNEVLRYLGPSMIVSAVRHRLYALSG